MIKKAPNTIDIDIQSRLNALKKNLISFNSNNNNNNNTTNNNNINFLPPRPPPLPLPSGHKQDNFFPNFLFPRNKQLLNKIIFDQYQEYHASHQHRRYRLMIAF